MKPLILFIAFFCLTGCVTVGVRTSAVAEAPMLSYQDTVRVVNVYEDVPAESTLIGELTTNGLASYKSCLYADFIAELRLEARIKGANILKLHEVTRPGGGENCFVVRASLHRNDDPVALTAYDQRYQNLNDSSLPDSADHALIHIYSPRRGGTGGFGRVVRLDGQRLGKLKNEQVLTYRTAVFGIRHFRVPSLGASSLLLDVQPGGEYFLSFAEVYDGALEVGTLFLVDNHVGRRESAGLAARDVPSLTTKR